MIVGVFGRTHTNKPYISQDDSEDLLIKNVLDKASRWKKSNPEAEVIIWYDSNFITAEAFKRTQAVLEKIANEEPSFRFNLKDIRQIDFVRQNTDALSDYLPIYYRVDLLKLILCVNSIESEGMDAAIFSDFEVGDQRKNKDRMCKEELFNPLIMERLNTFGIQVSSRGENQFFQILNKKGTINALKIYINACLSRAITALNCPDLDLREQYFLPDLSCAVFNVMVTQLFPLIEMVAFDKEVLVQEALFETNPTREWIRYDMEKHGYLPLGNFYDRKYNLCSYVCQDRNIIFPYSPGAEIDYENMIPFCQLIKFEKLKFNCEFSRDMETRGGRDHQEVRENLVKRDPADGSETYKFCVWQLNEKKQALNPLTWNRAPNKKIIDLLTQCGHFKDDNIAPIVASYLDTRPDSYPLEVEPTQPN